jgi:DNA mismatch repair protein MutS
MSMIAEYERLHREAVDLYGERVVVFMQIGTFYEMYWCPGSAGEASAEAARDRMSLALMNKQGPATRAKPNAAGFPHHLPDKVLPLLDDGWTVCLADQVPKTDPIRRAISKCISPGTRTDVRSESASGRSGNYACCVLTRGDQTAAAFIDVGTGCSLVTDGDGIAAAAESRNVTEVVFIGQGRPTGAPGRWNCLVHDKTDGSGMSETSAVLAPANVRAVLDQAFGRGPIMTEDMLLLGSRPQCRDALAYVLHFTKRHALQLGVGLPPPVIFEAGSHVSFSPNALQQLGVIKLAGVLNRAVTAPGRRWFKHRLCTPMCRPAEIRAKLDEIDAALSKDVDAFRVAMAGTGDLERLSRKVLQRSLQMTQVHQAVAQLGSAIDAAAVSGDSEPAEWGRAMIAALDPATGETPFADCAECVRARATAAAAAAALDSARAAIHPDAKLETTGDGHKITLTRTRWKTVPDEVKAALKETSTAGGVKVWNAELQELSEAVKESVTAVDAVLERRWADLLETAPAADLTRLAEWARDADVAYACAWNARKHGHVRPNVEDTAGGSFAATDLGNPVAEHFMETYTTETYVRNDVSLDADDQHVLLYSLNAAGKSTLLRAVGMCVIMAQAGMYAPAGSLTLSPFTRVDTRILTPDDVERGLSSFTAELVEAREALAAASPSSLFLADEIFSSTEWRSGTALVGTMICRLGDLGTRTFVTTHFHELLDHPGIKALPGLQVMHMAIRVTDVGLVYERKLQPGPCVPSYGLIVAAAYGFDAAFVREATAAREIISGTPEPRRSRYNKRVVVSKCEACGAPGTDSHHIRHRADAVDGKHGTVPEHHVSNLMVLCESCHKAAHKPGATVARVHTVAGPKVIVA